MATLKIVRLLINIIIELKNKIDIDTVSNSDYMWCALPSGLKVVYRYTDSNVSYCGFVVNAGTRDEVQGKEGLAHYVEHMLFKGTHKHKAIHILNCMERVGGEINAFTSKEETVIYTVSLEPDLKRAVTLMSDIIQNSSFPERESIKEKEVIVDEINSYLDNPAELIFDEFENHLFKNHDLGHNILGDTDSLSRITSADGLSFISDFYAQNNMVFFFSGKTRFDKVVKIVSEAVENIRTERVEFARKAPGLITRFDKHEECDNYQSHAIMGGRCYSIYDKERFNLFLLNNILGGPGMNSMLNVALREKRGYVYNVEANITNYSDTGLFTIYFGTDRKNVDKCFDIIRKNLNELKRKELSSQQLINAKRQYVGQLTIGRENRESLAVASGKALLFHGRCTTLADTIHKIESITAKDIIECANVVYADDNLSTLVLS